MSKKVVIVKREIEEGKNRQKLSLFLSHHRCPRVDPLGVVDEAVLGRDQLGLRRGLRDVLFFSVFWKRKKEREEEMNEKNSADG